MSHSDVQHPAGRSVCSHVDNGKATPGAYATKPPRACVSTLIPGGSEARYQCDRSLDADEGPRRAPHRSPVPAQLRMRRPEP